jgi:LacI family transcriptional regulator
MITDHLVEGKSSRITIKDVAKLADVSTATVSYVVNNRDCISVATKERVHAAMRVLNWAPNPSARRLAFQCRNFR